MACGEVNLPDSNYAKKGAMAIQAFPRATASGQNALIFLYLIVSLSTLLVSSSCGKPDKTGRIVSLSPTATEVLYAIGAGKNVVAVDTQSKFPVGTPIKNLFAFHPDVDAVVSYNPDLVIVAIDEVPLNSNKRKKIVSELERKGIKVLLHSAPKTLEGVYKQIEELGIETGHMNEATNLIETMMNNINIAVAGTPKPARPLRYYHELDKGYKIGTLDTEYYAVSSKSYIGSIYALFSLRSIADPFDQTGVGYHAVSDDEVIKANPDLIFLADTKCCIERALTVVDRPGWSQIAAVKKGQIIELDDDISSRWGPRLVNFVTAVSDTVRKATK